MLFGFSIHGKMSTVAGIVFESLGWRSKFKGQGDVFEGLDVPMALNKYGFAFEGKRVLIGE